MAVEAISILLLHNGFLILKTTNDCTGSEGLWLELHKIVWNEHYPWQISCNLMSQTWAFSRKSKKTQRIELKNSALGLLWLLPPFRVIHLQMMFATGFVVLWKQVGSQLDLWQHDLSSVLSWSLQDLLKFVSSEITGSEQWGTLGCCSQRNVCNTSSLTSLLKATVGYGVKTSLLGLTFRLQDRC